MEIKGSTHFKHVSETSNVKNTLEFLISSQKYINQISAPKLVSLANEKQNKPPVYIKPRSSAALKKSASETMKPITSPINPDDVPISQAHIRAYVTTRKKKPNKNLSST